MQRTRFVAAIVVGLAFVSVGCGRSLDDAKVATSDLTAEQRGVARASTALTRNGGPPAIVMTFLRDVADGAGPAALDFYDSRIPNRVGTDNLLGALDAMAKTTKDSIPAVVRRRNTRMGMLVVVRLLRTSAADSRHSFLVRRQGRGWKIVYDSLLVRELANYVLASRSRGPAKPPSGAARAAATRAVSALRAVALEPPSRTENAGR